MADLINLNSVRKARARAEDKARAATNRAVHGTPKSERAKAEAERQRQSHLLDQAKRDRPGSDD